MLRQIVEQTGELIETDVGDQTALI